jgi:hypothetical protein
LGLAVVVFAGGPAVVGELVVGSAGQGQVVDVGVVALGPWGEVVCFGEVGGYVAAWCGAAAVFGMNVPVVHGADRESRSC